jgi:hypothetical protein
MDGCQLDSDGDRRAKIAGQDERPVKYIRGLYRLAQYTTRLSVTGLGLLMTRKGRRDRRRGFSYLEASLCCGVHVDWGEVRPRHHLLEVDDETRARLDVP